MKHDDQIYGAPDVDLERSPAAQVIARLAAASGLSMAHYEHRHSLEVPEAWLPADRPDLAATSDWVQGVLPEHKYANFRNDTLIGSFNPGHRGKWTTHELCHALVGFAWKPDASLLFLSQAARLAELLPVALFYFFDEAGLNRCNAHVGLGPLFATFCPKCEQAAARPLQDRSDHGDWYAQGKRFVRRELEGIERSLKLHQPVETPWGSLNLCSDGLAYAAAQAPRLRSYEYAMLMDRFTGGRHGTLRGLELRVLEVMAALTGEGEAQPWSFTREYWYCRDLAGRLIEIMAQCDGDVYRELERLVDVLSAGDADALQSGMAGYQALHEEYELPEPELVFATGYTLPKQYGRDHAQVLDGVRSACPLTVEQLEEDKRWSTLGVQFVAADTFERQPLGRRFAHWLALQPGLEDIASLAEIEADIAHAPARSAAVLSLSGARQVGKLCHLAEDVVLAFPTPKAGAALGLPAGDDEAMLLIRRNPQSQAEVVAVEPRLKPFFEAIHRTGFAEVALIDEQDLNALLTQGYVVPERYAL